VVERWYLQDIRGYPSQQRHKLSKKEASVGDAKIGSEGEVRIFACLQDLDNGEWNVIDLTVETASDGSFRKTAPMRRYPCEKLNIREAPDWVVSGGVAVIAGRTETKAWTLGSGNFHAISYWAPKKVVLTLSD